MCKRERERERERETDRQTDRQTERQKEGERDKEAHPCLTTDLDKARVHPLNCLDNQHIFKCLQPKHRRMAIAYLYQSLENVPSLFGE